MTQPPETWAQLRAEALASLRVLVSLLDSEKSQPRLIEGYLESKRLLAEAFQALLRDRIRERVGLLDSVKVRIEEGMRSSFGGVIPNRYLRVRGYVSPHRELFAYLSLFVGKPVPAAVLRIITADAVHTERRTRELRDLGLQLDAVKTGGMDVYTLRSVDPDLEAAARVVIGHNLKSDKDLDPHRRQRLLAAIE
jgi:hypothetical protein